MQFTASSDATEQGSPPPDRSNFSIILGTDNFFRAFVVWYALMLLSLIPFYLASALAVRQNEIHGIQIGNASDIIIHGHNLECAKASPTRDCSMVIDGKLLEISAPIVDTDTVWRRGRVSCTAIFDGDQVGCRLAAVAGPKGGPYSTISGVLVSGRAFEESVSADRESWQNWRNSFLGFSPEEELTRYFAFWSGALLFALYVVLPLFLSFNRGRAFENPVSGMTVVLSLVGLAIGLLIIKNFSDASSVSNILMWSISVTVALWGSAYIYARVRRFDTNMKAVTANLSIRMIQLTALIPFVVAFSLIAMIMLGFDD